MSIVDLTHQDIKKSFIKVVNLVEPEHPHKDSPYPITESELEYGYKKSSSSYYASCGPRSGSKTVSFSSDKKYLNNCQIERILAIYVHELSHITVGGHSNFESGSHPPRFWRKVGFHAHILLDNWNSVEKIFESSVSKRKFIGYIVSEEVSPHNIDKRYSDTHTQRQEMATWFKDTLK